MVGDEESMPKSGVLTSPNYPESYPNDHDSTQTIKVTAGKTIRYNFTDFKTERNYDYVQLVDEGINLTRKIAGKGGFSGVTNSNVVHVNFHTDGSNGKSGWRMEWTESE